MLASDTKRDLRGQARDVRAQMEPGQRAEQAEGILRHLRAWLGWREAGRISCYRSFGAEVDTHAVFRAAWDEEKETAAPRIQGQSMRMHMVDAKTAWERGPFGVPQPPAQASIDDGPWGLVIVPGLLFDAYGQRIGQGGGFYDRFLAEHERAVSVGLSFRHERVLILPSEAHDRPVGWVATPDGIFRSDI